MSIECSECKHDMRGGHADDCSRGQPQVTVESDGNDCTLRLASKDGQCALSLTFEAFVPSWWRYVALHDDYNDDTGISIRHEGASVFVGKYESFGITISPDVWTDICDAMTKDR